MPVQSRDQRLSDLAALIADAAKDTGATVEPGESELVGARLNTEVWGGVSTEPPEDRQRRDLPPTVRALRLDGTPVLLGVLDGPEGEISVRDDLRRLRNQAMIARSWLGPDAQDLQLFTFGPLGSGTIPWWRDVARRIEADDRICRKLVWLPPETLSVDSVSDFLKRTFLAAPWRSSPVQSAMRLDQMSTIPLPEGWISLVGDDGLSVDAIVAGIVEVTE